MDNCIKIHFLVLQLQLYYIYIIAANSNGQDNNGQPCSGNNSAVNHSIVCNPGEEICCPPCVADAFEQANTNKCILITLDREYCIAELKFSCLNHCSRGCSIKYYKDSDVHLTFNESNMWTLKGYINTQELYLQVCAQVKNFTLEIHLCQNATTSIASITTEATISDEVSFSTISASSSLTTQHGNKQTADTRRQRNATSAVIASVIVIVVVIAIGAILGLVVNRYRRKKKLNHDTTKITEVSETEDTYDAISTDPANVYIELSGNTTVENSPKYSCSDDNKTYNIGRKEFGQNEGDVSNNAKAAENHYAERKTAIAHVDKSKVDGLDCNQAPLGPAADYFVLEAPREPSCPPESQCPEFEALADPFENHNHSNTMDTDANMVNNDVYQSSGNDTQMVDNDVYQALDTDSTILSNVDYQSSENDSQLVDNDVYKAGL